MGASSDRVRCAMALFRIGLGCVGARLRNLKNTGSLGPRLLKASRRRCGCGMEPMRRWRDQHLMASNKIGRRASLSQIGLRPTGVHWTACKMQIQSNCWMSHLVIKALRHPSGLALRVKFPREFLEQPVEQCRTLRRSTVVQTEELLLHIRQFIRNYYCNSE